MARCHDAARKETMKAYELGRAMETADWGATPSLASFCWKADTSAASCLYETVKAGLPGTMTAVESDEWENVFASVDILIDTEGIERINRSIGESATGYYMYKRTIAEKKQLDDSKQASRYLAACLIVNRQ